MIAIPNMEMPKGCRWCPLNHDSMCYAIQPYKFDETNGEQRRNDCPLIEIDHTNTELLEFYNEFMKRKASEAVAKYINAIYGERRTDE